MTSQKIIQQVKDCENLKVIRNPFIKVFLGLEQGKKEVVAEALSINNIVLLDENENVNVLALLPYLWVQLEDELKKELISSIRHLFKEHGIKIADLILKDDIDFIFAEFDLKELLWEWKDIQTLMTRFSNDEQSEHMRRYFESYMQSFDMANPLSDEMWQAFLDPLSKKERYWFFMHLNFDYFERFFARIDFLFSYLSDKHKVAILKRVDSNLIFRHIEKYIKDESFLPDKFKSFLKKFNKEDRKEVALFLKPEQLFPLIENGFELLKTLELFLEADRLDLLLYLGHVFLKKAFLEETSRDVSYCLSTICNLLPADHRVPFLTSFDKAYLQLITDGWWSNVARVINNLTSEEDAVFFECVGHAVIKDRINAEGIESVIIPLREEKRFGFLCLVRQLFPGLLEKIFVKGKDTDTVVRFTDTIELLPKEHQFSFFALFSEDDLRELYQAQVQYRTKNAPILHQYLETKNTNRLSNHNDNVVMVERSLLFAKPSSIEPQRILVYPEAESTSSQSEITQPNYFESLDTKIEKLAGPEYDSIAYNKLRHSLIELRSAVSLEFAKERRQCEDTSPWDGFCSWEKSSLKAVVDITAYFLQRFLDEPDSRERQRLIENYEFEIQPAKALKTIGKCLGVFIVAALCVATGAAFGLAIGVLSGSWTGPGCIVTGFAGLVAGAAGAGIAGFLFFKPSPMERAIGHLIHDSKKVVEEEIENCNELSAISLKRM